MDFNSPESSIAHANIKFARRVTVVKSEIFLQGIALLNSRSRSQISLGGSHLWSLTGEVKVCIQLGKFLVGVSMHNSVKFENRSIKQTQNYQFGTVLN